jgi:hypothetical protein
MLDLENLAAAAMDFERAKRCVSEEASDLLKH